MTISSTTRTAGPFTGNGATYIFPFAFKVFQAVDLYVASCVIATGVQSTLALNTDYTVSLNANQDSNPGGSVLLTAPLAVGYRLTVSSDLENLQPTEFINQGGFYPEVLTASLDRATIQIQQLQESVDLSLQFPITDPSTNNILPAVEERAGLLLGFDGNGAPIAVAQTSGSGGSGTAIIPFSATPVLDASLASQLKITLSGNVTSSTFLPNGAGVFFAVKVVQDGTGGHTFAWPVSFTNAGAVNTDPNSTSIQLFAIDNTGSVTALAPIMYS